MIDTIGARRCFPSLERRKKDSPVIYFDNPAGTQVPQSAIDGYATYFGLHNANVGGAFATSRETEDVIDTARHGMANFLGAASPREIIFGPNMTTLTFQLSHAIARVLQPGDEVVTTRLEHDANVAPWLALRERGVTVRWIELDTSTMTLDLESAEQVIGPRTRLVACGYASNAFGTVNDVHRIAELAHAVGAWLFVDAVHYAPHGPIDVQALDCDFLACSSYKFFGPHLGILYGREAILDELPAYKVRPASDDLPGKWETGSGNYEAMSALLGTLAYLRALTGDTGGSESEQLHSTMTAIKRSERDLTGRLLAGLASLPGAHVYGLTDPAQFDWRVPTASFTFEGHRPGDVAATLGALGIYTWAGNHYAIEPLAQLGLESTGRVGLVHYNLPEEVDRFIAALEEILRAG